MAKLILQKDNGEQIVVAMDVSEDLLTSDVLIRSDYIATKLWSKGDVAAKLVERGFKDTDKNISLVINTGMLSHLHDCTDEDWETINQAVDEVADKLEEQEDKYPQFIRIALFTSPSAPKYASYYAVLVGGNDLYGDVVLLEEVDIVDRSECFIPLFKRTTLDSWEWIVTETCTGDVLERLSEIYKTHAGISFNCEFMKFESPEDMLATIQADVDLYNVNTEEYVFNYNVEGSIAVYSIDKDKALELRKKSEESGEYWGAFLGIGGAIWDDPEHDDYVEGNSNLDYCKYAYNQNGWINVTPAVTEETK